MDLRTVQYTYRLYSLALSSLSNLPEPERSSGVAIIDGGERKRGITSLTTRKRKKIGRENNPTRQRLWAQETWIPSAIWGLKTNTIVGINSGTGSHRTRRFPLNYGKASFAKFPTAAFSASLRPAELSTTSVSIYLLRKGVPSGDITVHSDVIEALKLGLFIPPITSLSCQVEAAMAHRHLFSLRNIIQRSKSIAKLNLTFDQDLFEYKDPSHALSDTLGRVSFKTVMNPLRDILAAMSERFNGPVVIVNWIDIFTTRPRDIRHWNLHKFHFAGGLRNHIHKSAPTGGISTLVRLHDGSSARISPITSLLSIRIHKIPSITSRAGFSTLIEHFPWTLGQKSPSYKYCIGGPDLSAILPHLTLPALFWITLNTDDIDPVVLSEFLDRQQKISDLQYEPTTPTRSHGPLVAAALSLPVLRTFHSQDPANMMRLLAAVQASPGLSRFKFRFDRSTPDKITNLTLLLRRLAARTTEIHLQLSLATSDERPLSDEERAVASSLVVVRSVRMTIPDSAAQTRDFLSWLALLPQLRVVDFGSFLSHAGREKTNRRGSGGLTGRCCNNYRIKFPLRMVVPVPSEPLAESGGTTWIRFKLFALKEWPGTPLRRALSPNRIVPCTITVLPIIVCVYPYPDAAPSISSESLGGEEGRVVAAKVGYEICIFALRFGISVCGAEDRGR
ncbi:hypothetical protein B0H16DRAFT_1460635 [Mycena metata]|uniref:Uncharacterized protein n=1 Tax=Mycena metata TaxID=1033252 RepID=A0AAD7IX36_9AGAR|nr:hypothetical protein B0H16DRAFT_1460635 [Mycena metata]